MTGSCQASSYHFKTGHIEQSEKEGDREYHSSRSEDWEDCRSRTTWAKSLQDSISANGWAQWPVPVIPGLQGSMPGWPGLKVRPYQKNNQSKGPGSVAQVIASTRP